MMDDRRRPRGDAVALDAGLRPPRRPLADAWLRADTRGRDGDIRQELAAAVAAMRVRGSRRLSRTTLWPNPTSQTAPSPAIQGGRLLLLICAAEVGESGQHIQRHPGRRCGACQSNLARPQLSGGGLERGRSVIYRVFMNDEDFVVVYADSPEEAMLKLRDAGLEPVKAEPFDAHPRRPKGAAPAR